MSSSLIDSLIEMVTGDGRHEEKVTTLPLPPRLSNQLPYRAYDEETEIFYQRRSKGFILEISPLTGSQERIGDMIASIFSDVLEPGSYFSITSYASPRVAARLDGWALPRIRRGGVFATLARHRTDKLLGGAWRSLATDGHFHVREFRCFVAVGIKDGGRLKVPDLITMREAIETSFDSINVQSRRYSPKDLIQYFDEILAPTTGAGDKVADYNRYDELSMQCIRPDIIFRPMKDFFLLEAPSLRPSGHSVDGVPQMQDFRPERFDVRTMSVRDFPSYWANWDGQRLIGDLFNPKLALPCPVLQTISGVIPSTEVSESKASFKHARTTSLSEGTAAKYLPSLRKSSAEWEVAQNRVKGGEKLIQTYYAVSTIAPYGEGERAARAVKALYKAAGWDLLDERMIELPAFMSHFPLLMADGLDNDVGKRMGRFKSMLSYSIGSVAPVHGEYVGGDKPHLLFVGRRGQIQYWSPFQNSAGNHNVAIAGKSGSGKSVLLQDLTASFAGVGAKTIVIDDGRSFEHMAKVLGGKFTEFALSSGIAINPFKIVDEHEAATDEDYLVDCLAMLKSIVSQMARHETRLNDTERGFIDFAVNEVWNARHSDGTIDDICEALRTVDHPFAHDLATALVPFTSAGTFGRFFVGENNLDLSNDLTVFELSDLASRDELRGVVLTSIMFFASQTMRRMDRAIPKALIIDEAWQMLKGGAMADFVEAYSRTCRKYGASLITATQSIHDYYKSDGSRAALENSDWFLVLEQKPETISGLSDSGRFEMSKLTEQILRSLKRHGTDYSDIYVRGPECETVCRLVLDRYSATLYSSSPDVFGRIEELVHEGCAIEDAIERVAFPEQFDLKEAAE